MKFARIGDWNGLANKINRMAGETPAKKVMNYAVEFMKVHNERLFQIENVLVTAI